MRVQERNIRGFSLVEVNLAIFVVATGMLTLFSLFPAGLRQAASSHANTQEALFADYVFATLRSEAGALPAADWRASALVGVIESELDAETYHGNPDIMQAEFPAGGQNMLYKLDIQKKGNLLAATLLCQTGETGLAGYSVKRYEP